MKSKSEIIANSLLARFDINEAKSIAAYYVDAFKAKEIVMTDGLLKKDIEELLAGVPVQYVVGLSFFYGYEFELNRKVLIPRPETEELVYWGVSDFKENPDVKILDIGSGSGCILLTALLELENASGVAWDISQDAVKCIERNIAKYGLNAQVKIKDILNMEWQNENEKFDIIFCNPPYILEEERPRMGKHVLKYEPHIALFVEDEDPLIFYKKILKNLNYTLKENGVAYFETSDLYHEALESFMGTTQYSYEFRRDLQGKWRMLKVWI